MKQVRFLISTLLAATLRLFGSALAQQQDAEAVEDVAWQWKERLNQGDAEGLAELYAENATVYAASGQIREGRDAETARQQFAAGFTEASLENAERHRVHYRAHLLWNAPG